jgi:hypothetical protein
MDQGDKDYQEELDKSLDEEMKSIDRIEEEQHNILVE